VITKMSFRNRYEHGKCLDCKQDFEKNMRYCLGPGIMSAQNTNENGANPSQIGPVSFLLLMGALLF